MRKYEPKVYTYSHKAPKKRRSPMMSVLSALFTLIIAGGVGVLGYSVAKPILAYVNEHSAKQESQIALEESADQSASTEPATEESTEETTEARIALESLEGNGVVLSTAYLTDSATLEGQVMELRREYPEEDYLVIPLKTKGGSLYYASSVELAQKDGAVSSEITLQAIMDAAEKYSWIPVAEVSLLNDNLLPNVEAYAGYMAGSDRWLDNSKDNGGKAWVSPFSEVTQQYLTDIVTEISEAGFAEILCTDVNFPAFRQKDLELIGADVQSDTRGQTLANLVNQLAQVGTPIVLGVDATSVTEGTAEVLTAGVELQIEEIAVDLGQDYSTAEAVLNQLEVACPGKNCRFMCQSDSYEAAEEPLQQILKRGTVDGIFLYNDGITTTTNTAETQSESESVTERDGMENE